MWSDVRSGRARLEALQQSKQGTFFLSARPGLEERDVAVRDTPKANVGLRSVGLQVRTDASCAALSGCNLTQETANRHSFRRVLAAVELVRQRVKWRGAREDALRVK